MTTKGIFSYFLPVFIVIICFSKLLNASETYYSNISFKQISMEQGLPGANLRSQFQDHNGLIWFCTIKPFYQETWFKGILVVLMMALIMFGILQIRKRQTQLEKQINERTHKLEVAYRELLNKNTKIREQNRQIERQQANLEQKVTERTRDLEIAKRKAEESDKLKSSFLANMSHEIRTPLNAISGFSSLVSSDMYAPDRKQKYVNIIKSNVSSLLKLVEDILDVSKIEAGQITIEKNFFDVDSMISDIFEIFKEELSQIRGENVELKHKNTGRNPEAVMFNSDEIRLRQIISNLLNNAIKFTNKGYIELNYKVKNNSVLFWVKDTGIGIKNDNIESIFNRFTKLEDKNTTYRGTGLGLSICKSLIDIMDGKIWVESEIEKGSTFFVEIPGELILSEKMKPLKKKASIKNLDLSGKSILVIEDERSNFVLIQSYLSSTKAEVHWAHDGISGIEYCSRHKFDLIFIDIRMPDIDGYETNKRIKEIAPSTPVIAQTAYATYEDKKQLSSSGFVSYLIKPYSREDILGVIAELDL